jgi:hypothetical protein
MRKEKDPAATMSRGIAKVERAIEFLRGQIFHEAFGLRRLAGAF